MPDEALSYARRGFVLLAWSRRIDVLVLSCAGALGCGNRTESADGGSADGATQTVEVSTLKGSVSPCGAGFAHPNVCCASGPRQGTLCTENKAAPFLPCGRTSLTFPDPATCCPLDSDGACVRSAADAGVGSGLASCYFPCGPGAYSVIEDPGSVGPASACTDVGETNLPCDYCCWGAGLNTSCSSNQCFCSPSGPCRCGPQCSACPPGWRAASGVPDLCCRTAAATGTLECFSQADEIQPLLTSGCSGGGQTHTCECFEYTGDGNYYELSCGPADAPGCSCNVNGKKIRTLATFECAVSSYATLCGFP